MHNFALGEKRVEARGDCMTVRAHWTISFATVPILEAESTDRRLERDRRCSARSNAGRNSA